MGKRRPYRSGHWYSRATKDGYRSGLEKEFAAHLKAMQVAYDYETLKIKYTVPETEHTYTPDFLIKRNGIIIETKGRFVASDRKKHLLIKAQHPELDIRFVFSNAKAPIYKGSKTTNAKWCEKHGFKWAHRKIPASWLREARRNL